ncbi:hypothetical protein NIES23_47900 [Trichormus variabilis NIES-23]|uniref:Uncharacterized protein n=1 Tax=Trichormus variabilis NIES-23 TaxID=1973479 RepID=A0A1Z4KSH9_ANAVA|nr:hypothetical protein NIES23_47900 [Trichormus variabilis NIES-23]
MANLFNILSDQSLQKFFGEDIDNVRRSLL